MDAADLDYRARTLTGCVPPLLVARLLELGHEREVESWAGRGEWFCALAWARLLGHRGRREQALQVLAPYIATNWWPAARARAELLEGWGRIEEAIALLHTREATSVNGRDQLADLLARHDRITELREYAASEFHGHAVQRLAEVLEERGDVEGAIAAYRTFGATPDGMWHVAVPLSELLVRHGRSDEAIEVMRALAGRPDGAEDWIVHTLCTLYADHGRPEDGLAHLDALKARSGGQEEWDFFRMRLPLMADCGLLDEAIEQARAHPEGDTWYAAWALSDVLAEAGRTEEAAAVLEQHPTYNSSLRAQRLIDLGRIEDAVRVLRHPRTKPTTPAWNGAYSTEPPF